MAKNTVGRLIAGNSTDSADIVYATGFFAPDEFFYAEVDGHKYAFVSVLEFARAKAEMNQDVTVVDWAEISARAGSEYRGCLPAGISRVFGITKWIVPPRFPFCYVQQLKQFGIEVELENGMFFPQRKIKTAKEIEFIRAAMKATEEAQCQVREFIAESTINAQGYLEWKGKTLTCELIRSEVEAEFKRKSFSAVGTIISCGPDSALPHCTGSGPIAAGAPVIADIFPRSDVNGYWGDMTRTYVKGKACRRLREMHAAVLKVNESVEAMLKPGIECSAMQDFCIRTIEGAGFRTGHDADGIPCGFFHGLGHSLGLEIHEAPRFAQSDHELLKPGHVITVEPGVYYHDIGGVRIEDTVLITETGIENFCTLTKELEVS